MRYDRVVDFDPTYQAEWSCAFRMASGDFSDMWDWRNNRAYTDEEKHDRLWKHLCGILTVSEERSVIFVTTDKEPEYRDLVAACPLIDMVDEVRSRMGNYKVQLWIARKHKRNS